MFAWTWWICMLFNLVYFKNTNLCVCLLSLLWQELTKMSEKLLVGYKNWLFYILQVYSDENWISNLQVIIFAAGATKGFSMTKTFSSAKYGEISVWKIMTVRNDNLSEQKVELNKNQISEWAFSLTQIFTEKKVWWIY